MNKSCEHYENAVAAARLRAAETERDNVTFCNGIVDLNARVSGPALKNEQHSSHVVPSHSLCARQARQTRPSFTNEHRGLHEAQRVAKESKTDVATVSLQEFHGSHPIVCG